MLFKRLSVNIFPLKLLNEVNPSIFLPIKVLCYTVLNIAIM